MNAQGAEPGEKGDREPSDGTVTQTQELIQALLQQGVSPECILGVDPQGIPIICETGGHGEPASSSAPLRSQADLPAGTRGWETIPGIIRNDGVEGFRLEVDVNGPVKSVNLDTVSDALVPPELAPVRLHDDGLGEDRVAGDFIYTSGPFRYNTSFPMSDFYWHDPASPAGLDVKTVGTLAIEELDNSTTRFLLDPKIGVLRSNIPEITSTITLSPNVVVAPHLINIRSDSHETQGFLRFLGGNLSNLTNQVYDVLPDTFDFFVFFSTHKIERLPRLSVPNFNAGVHLSARVNYTGTGLFPFDNTAFFGSDGRLLGLNVLDAYERGIVSNNATHEIVHQWASFTDPLLGLSDGTAHYTYRGSVGSLVGGFLWIDNGDGTFTRDCTEGRNGAHHAPPLDKYMMGLIDGTEVAPLHVDLGTGPICLGEDIIDHFSTVTIEDIQSFHGVRTPGPADAQRDFALAFVVESRDRLLNPTELTFYEILAEHYTRVVPPQDPDPYLGFNWVPINRFFGEGTTWGSKIIFRGVTLDPSISAKSGIPGTALTYTLQVTNTGSVSDTFDVTVSGNTWPTTAPVTIGPLVAGASANADVIVNIPADLAGDSTDTAIISFSSQGDYTESATATLTTTAMAHRMFLPFIIKSPVTP